MKKIFILFLKVLSVLILSLSVFVMYLKSDFNKTIDENLMITLKEELNNSKPLPIDFIELQNQIKPFTNTDGLIYDRLIESYKRDCPCYDLVSYISRANNRLKFDHYAHSWKLEKEFTQEECYNLYLKHVDFTNGNIGIESAAKGFFNKKIRDLNLEEKITLIIMLENPARFNPIRFNERVNKKVNEIKNNLK